MSLIHTVIDAAFAYGSGIETLRAKYVGKTKDQVRAAIFADVASHPKYRVPLIDGEGKAKGSKVLDKAHANYEACRKALSRLVNDISGEVSAKREELFKPTKAQLKAAMDFLAMFEGETLNAQAATARKVLSAITK
jgi:hypothetical protein